MNKNKLTFWGVRGSNPTPDKNKMIYGGHTSCVSLQTTHDELLVFDMGTGLKNLGESLVADVNSPKTIHIILSHYHWDHMIGLLSFAPLFIEDFTIHFYGKKDKMNIKEAKYIKNQENRVCGIKVTLEDNTVLQVPRSLGNTDYAEIQRQVNAGTLTIKDAD